MKNRDIYLRALAILGESCDLEENEDYEERAPYLIAAFCTEAKETDASYRESMKMSPAKEIDCVHIPLEAAFPLADRFINAAANYLAAMLIIDENTALSDKIYDKYCDLMATIQSEIPASIEKIAQKYSAL
jgi:hypothetical protein